MKPADNGFYQGGDVADDLREALDVLQHLCDTCEELRLNYTDPAGVGEAMEKAAAVLCKRPEDAQASDSQKED